MGPTRNINGLRQKIKGRVTKSPASLPIPYLLDGLLEHNTELQPEQIITDTAGYCDLIFGLFWLLGFQFSPRLADLGDARYWRIDPDRKSTRLNSSHSSI